MENIMIKNQLIILSDLPLSEKIDSTEGSESFIKYGYCGPK